MKMNSSKSSFDPFDYYKKITHVLANKKNTRIAIPLKEERFSGPLITKQQIQAKFLAKYNTEKQQQTSQEAKTSAERNSQKVSFKVKTQEPIRTKRKKAQEGYINLPDSFFKSFDGSNMSIFKVPEVPAKKQKQDQRIEKPSQGVKRSQENPEQTQNHRDPNGYLNLTPSFFKPAAIKSNMTLGSVNSASFHPGLSSTPIENNLPMFSDPDDVLKPLKTKIKSVPQGKETLEMRVEKLLQLVDKTSKVIDAQLFADQPDPISEIMQRVKDIHSLSCQSPRLINETLMSTSEQSPTISENSQPKRSLPLPEFFEQVQPNSKKTQTLQTFEKTTDIFGAFPKSGLTVIETPAANLDEIFSSDFLSDSPSFSCNSQEFSPLLSQQSFKLNSPMVVDHFFNVESPLSEFSMEWEIPNEDESNDTFAIFNSPSEKATRSSSQRSKNSNKESTRDSSSRHPNSSLSTYKWTPNMNHEELNSTQSTFAEDFESFQPRNIFKNSFKLF